MYLWFAETLQTNKEENRKAFAGGNFFQKNFKSRIKCSKNTQNSEYQWWVRLLNIGLSTATQTKVSIMAFEKCGLGKDIEVATVSLWNLEMRTCKAETMKLKCICLCTWKMAAPCNEKAPNQLSGVPVPSSSGIPLGELLTFLASIYFQIENSGPDQWFTTLAAYYSVQEAL